MAICWISLERSKEDSVTASRGPLVSIFFTICAYNRLQKHFLRKYCKNKTQTLYRRNWPWDVFFDSIVLINLNALPLWIGVFFWIFIRSLRQCGEIKFFLFFLWWTTIYSFYNWSNHLTFDWPWKSCCTYCVLVLLGNDWRFDWGSQT